ncbi:Serine-threonine protein kinase [Entamoeba marina]
MFIFAYLFLIAVSVEVNETEFLRDIVCGDGVWDSFNEECDSSDNCGSDCLCELGFTADGNGNCVMQCMYGDSCSSSCLLPDICEVCNTSNGYTSDCQGCLDGYMWYGEGNCQPIDVNTVNSCGEFMEALTADEELMYKFDLSTDDYSGGVEITIPDTLFINRCSRHVHPTKPYTYGAYLEILSNTSRYVAIEVESQYTRDDLILAELQEQTVGVDLGIVAQEDCISGHDLDDKVQCLFRNAGLSDYVLSPSIFTWLTADVEQYIFVYTKYAATPPSTFTLYVTEIEHPCSYHYYEIDWNDIAGGGYERTLNLEHSTSSRSICSKDIMKGFWSRIKGAEQTIIISTCQSEDYDVSLDLIAVNMTNFGASESDLSPINCESSTGLDENYFGSKCVRSRSDGCGDDSKLAQMVYTMSEDYTYFLFVGINEEYSAEIVLTLNTTCPLDCGDNGICSSYSGQCECFDGYVFKNEGCTQCGNGVLDENEDCDLSVDGYEDPLCTSSCNCAYGTIPVTIDGVTKCAPPTCGNGEVDEYEECDGGFGCDHCVCVNNTTKYAKARAGCLVSTCGDKKWDEGEECDGGNGCVECECQENYYSQNQADCSPLSNAMIHTLFWGSGLLAYIVVYLLGLIVSFGAHFFITRKIRREIEDEKTVIFENTVIPFDKNNSQYIDLKSKNPYFQFSSTAIEFNDVRPEINDPVETTVTLTNTWKEQLHFTFHSRDYPKYEIMSKPFTGTIKSGDSVTLNITFMAKCTTLLNEKIPITLRYGQLGNILKDIRKDNPDLIAQNSQSSQNSESTERRSVSSGTNGSHKISHGSAPKSNPSNKSDSDASSSKKKKKTGKSKVSKFHVYLGLQVESALSTKLDYEEIHLQHPPIGGGTFGIVYRAEWRRVDVAAKVMKTDLVGLAELLPNFMQEAEMMERIRCPYIVNFIGSVVTADTLCLVTEFCPLGSLRKYMKTNAMTDILKVRFCQDIARGMEYLHQNDILHRDLKTDNVLVYSKNPHDPITAKVTDFGTSRSFIESSGKIALQNIGTPVYMAPEISRKDQMTLKSDIFSFAVCMLEIMIGKDPYDPMKFPDSDSVLKFVCSGKRLEIDDSIMLKDIIEMAWKHKPAERPTFKEVGTMLDGKFKLLNDKSKSDSEKKQSRTNTTKSHELSSTDKKTTTTSTHTEEESIDASVSSQVNKKTTTSTHSEEESIEVSISSQVN